MRPPLPRSALSLLWNTLRPRRTPPRTDPTPDPATLARQTSPVLRRLYELHRPHTEHDITVCFECGLPWPCRTRTTLDNATTLADCPHCDPEHRPPWNGSWGVYTSPALDGDRQPTALHVTRPDGAHVCERDATWVRDVLTAAATEHDRADTGLPQDEATARAQQAAIRTTQHAMALDLHQALHQSLDPHADHQGHLSFADWWAHLLGQVRTTHTSAEAPPPPRGGSALYAQVLDTLTRALADRQHHLPLADRQHLTHQLLHALADDLLDEDTVPEPGEATLSPGRARHLWCHQCHTRSRFHLTTYLTGTETILPVGCTDVCTNCLHTPYTPTTPADD